MASLLLLGGRPLTLLLCGTATAVFRKCPPLRRRCSPTCSVNL